MSRWPALIIRAEMGRHDGDLKKAADFLGVPLLRAIMILIRDNEIMDAEVPADFVAASEPELVPTLTRAVRLRDFNLRRAEESLRKDMIALTLDHARGNKTKAAELLGVTRFTLHRYLRGEVDGLEG